MAGKYEQTIDDIYELLDNCKYAAFSNKESIVVNKEDIYELLEELRSRTPEEIRMYSKMIVNQEAILEKAREKGDQIIAKAQAYQNEMVNENEIMQQAYAQANEIVTQARINAQELLTSATTDANNYQMSAVQYTDDALASLQEIINRAITSAEDRYSELINSLNDAMNRVTANRAQLSRQVDADIPVTGMMGQTATIPIEPNMGDAVPEVQAPVQNPEEAVPQARPPIKPRSDDGIDIL